jgi:hypothetical protein
MSIGRRMLAVFERRPGLFHAALTGFRPAWNAFRDITRGSTNLAELVRSHPMAQRALTALDKRQVDGPSPAGERPGARGEPVLEGDSPVGGDVTS